MPPLVLCVRSNPCSANLESKRQTKVSAVFKCLKTQIELYQGPSTVCQTSTFGTTGHNTVAATNEACDGLVLGTLLMNATAEGIWPLPEVPFHCWTISEAILRVRSIQATSVCDVVGRPSYYSSSGTPNHGVMDRIEFGIQKIDFTALNISRFKAA